MSAGTTIRDPRDPLNAHSADLLGKRVRVDFGARVDTGEILKVSDDHLRGREIRVRVETGDSCRCVTVDPEQEDVELVSRGGDVA